MLLQGDALAVQLFIGAAALTALSVAATQAGWTHKWFVRGMFGLAALLAIASTGWRYIEARIPLLDGALQAAASSRIVWFVSGIVPALIVGMLIRDQLRRRRESHVKILPPGWVSVDTARRTLAQQDLLARYAHVGEEVSHNAEEAVILDAEIAQLERAIPASKQERKLYAEHKEGLQRSRFARSQR
jgi:hypothetical protein